MRDTELSYFKDGSASSLLGLLIAADVVFIGLHYLWGTSAILSNDLFALTQERGYAEVYQYVKFFWIVLLLIAIFWKTKSVGYLAWAALFAYLLADDSLSIHERVGFAIAQNLEFTPLFGLRPPDFGELLVTAIIAGILLSLIGIFYLRGSNDFRRITRDLLIFLLIIAFFGIVVDMLHVAINFGWRVTFILSIIEDGGELLIISIVTWYVFLLKIRGGSTKFSIFRLVVNILPDRIFNTNGEQTLC